MNPAELCSHRNSSRNQIERFFHEIATLSYLLKHRRHVREQTKASEISHKKSQSRTAGKNIIDYFDIVNNCFTFVRPPLSRVGELELY
jgi:hypothetical protein